MERKIFSVEYLLSLSLSLYATIIVVALIMLLIKRGKQCAWHEWRIVVNYDVTGCIVIINASNERQSARILAAPKISTEKGCRSVEISRFTT